MLWSLYPIVRSLYIDLCTYTKFSATEVCQGDSSGILSWILAEKLNARVAGFYFDFLITRYPSSSRHIDSQSNITLFYIFLKICFSPKGNHILTASSDKTARLWDAATGHCLQILEGHTDEIFSCAFNYKGDIIITGSQYIPFFFLFLRDVLKLLMEKN